MLCYVMLCYVMLCYVLEFQRKHLFYGQEIDPEHWVHLIA